MPLYEYQCADCNYVFERMQKISDPPPTTCEKCGGNKVSKLISQTAFVLKGGGWYNEGYGSKKPAAATDSTSKPAAKDTKDTPAKDTKSDSSPKKS